MRETDKQENQQAADEFAENEEPESAVDADGQMDNAEDAEPSAEEEIDEFTQLQIERDDYLDQLQRSRADFANFRRRTEQERAVQRKLVTRDVLAQFLPVIDDVERGLEGVPEDQRDNGWFTGFTMVQSKFTGILERAGVQRIEALNAPFDPAVHEAVATDPESSGSHVVEVYQQGYQLEDQLLRPAMVKTGDPQH